MSRTRHLFDKNVLLYICVILLSSKFPSFSCFKINTPGVLLAYNKGMPSNFTLEVSDFKKDECFEYFSSNPKIISITPLFEHTNAKNCSRKAILSSVADLKERRITEISVKEKDGEKTLFCHVLTDVISSIELKYISDELILEGPPQKISVVAKDKEGHVFDSINGLVVDWQVKSEDERDAIRITKMYGSDYGASENVLEKRGFYSASVLVEPLHLGSSVITASLLYSSSKSELQTKEVSLKVLPNLKIYPESPLYLLRHSSTKIKFETFRRKAINLEDFTADVDESNVIKFEKSELHAKEYGKSSIIFKNKEFPDELATSLDVHTVKLARIGFRFSDGDFKILEQMKVYELNMDLFDANDNIIHVSDNLRFSVTFPTKLFHVIYTSNNGTYFVLQAVSPGHGNIRADYKGAILEDGSLSKENGISEVLKISIYQKLDLFPPYTLLPVLSDNPMHKIDLKVSGGTGNYQWSLSDYTAAKITVKDNKSAQLEIYNEIPDLIVTVADEKNCNFVTTAKISVQKPLDIEAYPTVTESELGNVLIVPIALLGYEDKEKDIIRKFDDCSKSNITVDIVDKFVLAYEEEAYIPAFGKGCKSLQLRCKMAGHSRVNIKFTLSAADVMYNTTIMLSCFKPLKPVYPVRVAISALGTSMEIAAEGGPRKWPLFKDGHFTELKAEHPDKLNIFLIRDPVRYNKDLTVFRVTCLELGENTLTFRIGNEPSATLKHPAKSEASIKFICAEPHTLHLKIHKKNSKRESSDNIVKVPFFGEKTFSLDVFVKDAMGRKFGNISSLRMLWDVSDESLAYPQSVSEFDYETHENAVAGYRKISRNFKEFKMTGSTGDLKVKAKITSYRKDCLSKEGIEEYKELEEISKSIDLKLVSLRDVNSGLYDEAKAKILEENGYCENDSCKS